ncbi:MAG TPA: glycosyltransferase family 39 protein [Gemmatimonadaceae bacterium]|nr:glycosyltransferase family 39 protein [Gemmatimonadaceae bacterium]
MNALEQFSFGVNSADTSDARGHRTGRQLALVAGILLAHVILAWYFRVWGITTGDDDAGYLLLARALRAGHYRELHDAALFVGAKYPPGYPALLALMGLFAGENITAFLLISIVSSAIALWLAYDAIHRLWGFALGVTVLALAALNPFLILNAGRLMSEAPFMALLMLMLWAIARKPQTTGMAVVAGAAAIAGGLTRSAGVTLVPALGLLWLLERRIKALVIFGVASALTVGAWTAWIISAPSSKERDLYVADAVAFVGKGPSVPLAFARRTFNNAREYATQFVPNALSVPTVSGTAVDNAIVVVLLAVFLSVGVFAVWRRWRLVVLFLAVYGTLLVLWAFAIDRFVEPILPLILLTVLVGSDTTLAWRTRRGAAALTLAIALSIGLRSLTTDVRVLQAAATCDRSNPTESPGCVSADETAFFQAAKYIGQTTEPNAIVLTAKPRPFYYYSGRRTVNQNIVLSRPPAETADRVRASGAQYVLITELGFWPKEFRENITGACESFTVVREFPPRAVLLRLRDQGEASACDVLRRPLPPAAASPTGGFSSVPSLIR